MATSYEERRNAIIDEALDATPSVPRLRKLKAKALRQMMMPIYSKREGVYQMDTMEQSDAIKNIQHVNGVSTRSGDNDKINALHDDLKDEYPPYYLILINVNTRKGYAYPMESKNEDSVHQAVNDFYIDVYSSRGRVTELFTDEDSAYKGAKMQKWYREYKVDHVTTTHENKHTLGIINRFIRTIRDRLGTRNISRRRMAAFINRYNDTRQKGINLRPNNVTKSQEKQYVMDQYQKEQAIKAATMLDTSQKARKWIETKQFEKRRADYEPETYDITGLKGRLYQIKSGKNSYNVSRWKLRVGEGIKVPKGEPVRILDWNDDVNMYEVECDSTEIGLYSIKRLRGDEPYKLHPLERQFWRLKPRNSMPVAVKTLWSKQPLRMTKT